MRAAECEVQEVPCGHFCVRCVDPSGRSVKGKVEADNEQVVLAKLHEQHFHIVSLNEAKAGLKLGLAARASKVKLQSLVVFSRQFATMIDAGIAIIKCLDILESQTKDEGLKGVITPPGRRQGRPVPHRRYLQTPARFQQALHQHDQSRRESAAFWM